MNSLHSLKIKIFADGADKAGMLALNSNPLIKGMTTNPTLMNKAGIKDYEKFAREILTEIHEKPISFEVFSDDFKEMRRQALKISKWQNNVYVKIPITNSKGEPSLALIKELVEEGVKLNITAILTAEQVKKVVTVLLPQLPSIVSVFAGRIADTGTDPVPIMQTAKMLLKNHPQAELLWASVREVLNIYQAEQCECQIVTVTHDVLNKVFKMWGLDLTELSLDTVKMFAADAKAAGFSL